MKILRNDNDLNIILNGQQIFKPDAGWSENFEDFEKESLESIINPIKDYETIRYIHEPYSGLTINTSHTQSDIWFYFYFISGGTQYVQNYEAVGISNDDNAKMLLDSTKSFFRLEFYKVPSGETPTRLNRRFVFAKNLSLPLGEKFYCTNNDFNDTIHVPVFKGTNYYNKENMYIFWFHNDTALDETSLTGNTFYMAARFFNANDGSIIEFTNKDLSVDNSGLISERRGKKTEPIKFYEKGISGATEIDEADDIYYRVTISRADYSYKVFYDV